MDPATLATMAVGLIAPYLAEAGKALAKEAGTAAAKAAPKLYASIQKKFHGDAYAASTLKRLEEQPESPNRKAALADVLEEKIREDSDFAGMLEKVHEEIQGSGNVVTQSIDIGNNSQTGDISMIGMGGEINPGPRRQGSRRRKSSSK